jgi:hypothetical protein
MTMQTELMIGELALDQGGWLINRLEMNFGGRALEIAAKYDDRPFRLVFKDFHILSWEIFRDEYDPGIMNVDVIGLDFGEREHRKAAVLHTVLFEIIVSYGELAIEKDW